MKSDGINIHNYNQTSDIVSPLHSQMIYDICNSIKKKSWKYLSTSYLQD